MSYEPKRATSSVGIAAHSMNTTRDWGLDFIIRHSSVEDGGRKGLIASHFIEGMSNTTSNNGKPVNSTPRAVPRRGDHERTVDHRHHHHHHQKRSLTSTTHNHRHYARSSSTLQQLRRLEHDESSAPVAATSTAKQARPRYLPLLIFFFFVLGGGYFFLLYFYLNTRITAFSTQD